MTVPWPAWHRQNSKENQDDSSLLCRSDHSPRLPIIRHLNKQRPGDWRRLAPRSKVMRCSPCMSFIIHAHHSLTALSGTGSQLGGLASPCPCAQLLILIFETLGSTSTPGLPAPRRRCRPLVQGLRVEKRNGPAVTTTPRGQNGRSLADGTGI